MLESKLDVLFSNNSFSKVNVQFLLELCNVNNACREDKVS